MSPKRFLRDKTGSTASQAAFFPADSSKHASVKIAPGQARSAKNSAGGGRDLQELSLHSHEMHTEYSN